MSERKIRLLDDKTINQIAAGEVIENSASVIKELIENSLDAGSSKIIIETKQNFIRVIDDGCGIGKEDLPLALERHATSKMASIHDLDLLKSLGFRGEALASIASVSKLSLLSSSDFSGLGHFIETHGSKEHTRKEVARQRGTTVEVSSLFYNVPVRKKFQKSEQAETSAVSKILTQMALAYPSVGFRWTHQGEIQFDFEKDGSLLERVRVLLGGEIAASLFPVEHDSSFFSIKGYTGHPTLHRPNRSGQFLFINGRSVVVPFVSQKILEGYATRLPTHRFPVFILSLQLPSEWIDVNVHPQKKEIRFQNENKLGAFLIQALEESLQRKERPTPINVHLPPLAKTNESSFFPNEISPLETENREKSSSITPFFSNIQVLGKCGSFLFVEREGLWLIVDLKRARSKILLESFNQKSNSSIQQLLIPINLEFSQSETFKLLDQLEALNQLGIGIRFFGNKTFIVDALPQYVEKEEVKSLLLAFLEGDKKNKEKALTAAIQKPSFSLEEARRIVERLFQCEGFEIAPDGKKICLILSEKELEKRFHEED